MLPEKISDGQKLDIPVEVMHGLYNRAFKKQYDDIQEYTVCLEKLGDYGVPYEDIEMAISRIVEETIALQAVVLDEIYKVLQKRKTDVDNWKYERKY